MKKIIITVVLLISMLAFSASFIEKYGHMNSSFTGRALALSGNDLFGASPEAVLFNPAFALPEDGLKIIFGANVLRLSEDRSFPAYSFFDNLIGYQTYVDNTHYNEEIPLYAAKSFQFGEITLGTSLSYLPVIEMNYTFYEEIRDITDPEPNKMAVNRYEISGALNSFGLSLGVNFLENFHVGYTLGILSGEMTTLNSIELTPYGEGVNPSPDPTRSNTSTVALSGVMNVFGAGVNFKRFALAASYRTIGDVAGKYDSLDSTDGELAIDDATLIYPPTLTVALHYRPRSGIFSTMSLSYKKTMWSEFEADFEKDAQFYDTDEYSLGVEHIFDTGAIFRFGVFYRENYEIDNLAETGITLGTGFKFLERFSFDLGMEFLPVRYETMDLFPESAYDDFFDDNITDRISPDKIQDYRLKAAFTLGMNF
ncbi:hypothetical protein KAJ26_02345 [bacterium]|nr:hypothetical protein [bacterium]